MGKKWTGEEIDVLRERYATATRAELRAIFAPRSIETIRVKAVCLGLRRNVAPKLSRDEIARRKRELAAKRRKEDPERVKRLCRLWYASKRAERRAVMRAYCARRFFWVKAMKLTGSDRATTRELAKLWKLQRGLCALSGRRLDRSAQLDHKVPKARGGRDNLSNLQWLSREVNLAKRDLTDVEFRKVCSDVVRWEMNP